MFLHILLYVYVYNIYTIHGVIKYIEQKCSWTYIHVKACKQIASSVVNCINILIGICYNITFERTSSPICTFGSFNLL